MTIKQIWHFIWYEDSLLSWFVNIILALILVKFIIYPGLGLLFGTTHPLVAVVSSSMDHRGLQFDEWWEKYGNWYEQQGITRETFAKYGFKHGFNKGDIMVLKGIREKKVGDVLVYKKESSQDPPIIHRVVHMSTNTFQTKGDNVAIVQDFEKEIGNSAIIGKAILRIPYLGYIKIFFIDFIFNPIIGMFK